MCCLHVCLPRKTLNENNINQKKPVKDKDGLVENVSVIKKINISGDNADRPGDTTLMEAI